MCYYSVWREYLSEYLASRERNNQLQVLIRPPRQSSLFFGLRFIGLRFIGTREGAAVDGSRESDNETLHFTQTYLDFILQRRETRLFFLVEQRFGTKLRTLCLNTSGSV